MLEIRVLDSAQDFLNTLDKKRLQQISNKILVLAENPYPAQSKQLEGYAPLRRVKAGDYRIIYFVENNILMIPLIERRGDGEVYKKISRKFRTN